VPAPIPKKISQILPTFQNVSQSSTYLVKFALPPHSNNDGYSLGHHLRRKGVDFRFMGDKIGLLCSSAALPGSAMASVDVVGDYQGVVERFAHTRNYTQITLEFYVDNLYKSLKFLEHWMEYISGANPEDVNSTETYHFKMRYPELYKSNETRIVKFEKNYRQFLEYKFIGLFPLSLNSTRVAYQNSQVLKATCSFSYDRYICGQSTTAAVDRGVDLEKSNVYNDRPYTFPDVIKSQLGGDTYLINTPTGKVDVNSSSSNNDGSNLTSDYVFDGSLGGWSDVPMSSTIV
tara:strand:+ start:2505 stop:3371 length:867 start_codon:yes stop_codon:yes gene_type:complete